MTDVWRSVPKKFCNMCKCWFYDNRVSIEHHERGARHQENVRNKIRELGKKGREREKEDRETMKALAQMEKEAIRSYKDDLKNQPEVAEAYNIHLNLNAIHVKGSNTGIQPRLKLRPDVSTVWRELLDESSGLPYYWNSKTNETSWEKPSDGYLSLDEQRMAFEIEKGGSADPTYSNPTEDPPTVTSDSVNESTVTIDSVNKSTVTTNDRLNKPTVTTNDGVNKPTVTTSDDVNEPTTSERKTERTIGKAFESANKCDKKLSATVTGQSGDRRADDVGLKRKHVLGEWETVESAPVITNVNKPPDQQTELFADVDDESQKKKIKFEEKKTPSFGKSSKALGDNRQISFKKASKAGRNLRERAND